MRQSPSIEPFTPSPNVQLHPTIQAVLDSLDVQVEEELNRYRRQRRQPAVRPRRQVRPQDSTALGILQQSIQLPTLGTSLYQTGEPPSRPAAPVAPTHPVSANSGVSVWSAESFVPGARTAEPASQSVSASFAAARSPYTGPSEGNAAVVHQSLQSLQSLQPPGPAPAPDLAASPEPAPAEIASYANQYDLSAYAPNSTLQRLMHQAGIASTGANSLQSQTAIVNPEDRLEDYLASSEELLRSIAEESREQLTDREPNALLDTLLTPLGVGSMLLLLLTSTTLGYVLMNPTSVGLSSGGLNGGSVPASQPAPTAAQTMRGSAANQALPSPNLAADEFVDLGLDTLSTIPRAKGQRPKTTVSPKPAASEAKPATKPTDSGEPVAAPTRSVEPPATVVMPTVVDSTRLPELPAAPAPQPSLATVVVPARPPISEPPPAISTNIAPVSPEPIRTTPPAIQPAPLPPVEPAPSMATAPSAEAAQSRYYVVTDYSGDASLEAARTAVPDAYVRNLPDAGAKVQLGSFNDQAGAEGLRQQLEQQGIEAEVYQP